MQKVQKKRSYGTVHELTDKEKEIVQAICEKGITKIYKLAQYFCLSEATIKTHLKGIYSKCFVNSIADLMFQYYKKRGEQ